MLLIRSVVRSLVIAIASFGAALDSASAQDRASRGSVEVCIALSAQHSLRVNSGDSFWTNGGSIELGANAYHGLGLAGEIAGVQTKSIGDSGIPLAVVTEIFGPRYRWHDGHRFSMFGQGLVGEVNAFNSLFPSISGAQSDATALATRVGGGVDLATGRHLAIRALEVSWMRTKLPNSTTDVQNNLQVSAGLVLRLGR